MSHTPNMPDSAGEFGDERPADVECRRCKAPRVGVRTWDSSCGGWTDYHYRCAECGHSWWVEGADS